MLNIKYTKTLTAILLSTIGAAAYASPFYVNLGVGPALMLEKAPGTTTLYTSYSIPATKTSNSDTYPAALENLAFGVELPYNTFFEMDTKVSSPFNVNYTTVGNGDFSQKINYQAYDALLGINVPINNSFSMQIKGGAAYVMTHNYMSQLENTSMQDRSFNNIGWRPEYTLSVTYKPSQESNTAIVLEFENIMGSNSNNPESTKETHHVETIDSQKIPDLYAVTLGFKFNF